MNVFFFGQLADIAGDAVVTVPRVASTDQLRDYLLAQYPRLRERTFLITVDKKIARTTLPIEERSEVALLPPFSGG